MAAVMATTSQPPSTPQPSTLPSRNPLPLSASQESQVRELYYKRVRSKCADEVRDFAACCTDRTFTATLMCRAERRAMNACMLRFATAAEQDAAREEWFATAAARREERARKEAQRQVDEKFWRAWWDKDAAGVPRKEEVAGGDAPKGAEQGSK